MSMLLYATSQQQRWWQQHVLVRSMTLHAVVATLGLYQASDMMLD